MTSSGAGGVAALRPLPGLGPAGGGSAMRRINSSWSFHPKLQGKDSRCLGSSCFIDRCSLSLLASRGEQKVSELPPCHKYPISKLPEELSPRQFSFDGNWRNVMLPTAGGERASAMDMGQVLPQVTYLLLPYCRIKKMSLWKTGQRQLLGVAVGYHFQEGKKITSFLIL
ncbi:putative uncharacterized protein C8orf89 homolog isoform X2 [Rhinatrema bivittatum]|uniref:putative uncharacterized protein C8orf89 homolog isoform X2 n=1 Tax=Rhinatrema bivittatum TaxID=194408 RepID=UPI00112B3826|nr:putative uncharacterized protein C8orf89 homolog isoform X2 [Rhinatrema bivittatum]